MKKPLLCLLLIGVFLSAAAQLPETSTHDHPIWYYIQVVGEGSSRENRVWTAEGEDLYGRPMNVADAAETDRQLFRFEKDGDNFIIINKSTNKKADAVYKNESRLAMSSSGIPFTIALIPGTGYYNIETTKTPAGGPAGEKWAHQANSYRVVLTSTAYYRSANSSYSFVAYDEIALQYSSSGAETWYYLSGAHPDFQNKCITDETGHPVNQAVNFSIKDKEAGSPAQQWKLVKKAGSSRVDFVNRATGNVINTASAAGGFHNYMQFTKNAGDTNGWTLLLNNGGQYTICGVEEDGIRRYWRITTDEEIPGKYPGKNKAFSSFAWKIKKAADGGSHIKPAVSGSGFTAYTRQRKIIVENAEDYTIRNMQGMQMNKTEEFSPGVYLVTAENTTIKVLVNQ